MINYLLEVTLAWTGFYLLYVFFLSKETFFKLNRGYLLTTLVLGLLLPLANFGEWISAGTPVDNAMFYLEPITVTVKSIEQNMEAVVVAPIAETLSVSDVLPWVYWIGVLFMFFRFGAGLFQIGRLYFQNEKQNTDGYTLVMTDKDHLPFSFFHLFFRSKNLQLSPVDQAKITEHEMAHIKGLHSIDVIVLELVSIFLWCSPLVHFYKKSLRYIHEYLADANVLQNTTKKHYGQLLLQLFQTSPGVALANNFIHSQLKKRIKMMTKTPSSKRAYWKYFIALPVLGLLTLVLTNTEAIAQEKTTDVAIGKEIKTIDQNTADPIFTVVEEMPRFPGCEDITDKRERKDCSNKNLLTFVAQNIKYPEAAQKAGVEGVVVIKYVIGKDGNVHSPQLLRDIGGGCGKEAMRVVNLLPKHIPGKQRGKNVAVYFNLPVRFKLDKDADSPKKAEPKAAPRAAFDVDSDVDGEVFTVVEEMPRFPGCEHITDDKDERKTCWQTAMINFVLEHVKFPKEAKEAGLEGMAVVEFVVSKNGDVLNPKILRSIGMGCDEAVLNVVEQMNAMDEKWISGKQRGIPVNVRFVLPVKFKLDETAAPKNEAAKESQNNTLGVNEMTISPNPSTSNEVTVTYELETASDNLTLQATDVNGKVIATINKLPRQLNNTIALDISKAAPGAIFISLIDGEKIYTKQLLKQ